MEKTNNIIHRANHLRWFAIGISLFLLQISELSGQFPCGTVLNPAQTSFETAIINTYTDLIELKRTIQVTVHIVLTKEGETEVNPADIASAMSELNGAFDRIKLVFNHASTHNIANYQYNLVKIDSNSAFLITENYVKNTINLYLMSDLISATGDSICSYTFYPHSGREIILMRKECLQGNQLIEQIGHMFNLYHTHETAFGPGLVNNSNCNTTGDRCCDTYADPNISGMVSETCEYLGTLKDSNNQFYTPSTKNYMSASPLSCRCYFSDKQYLRMLNLLVRYKNYLW